MCTCWPACLHGCAESGGDGEADGMEVRLLVTSTGASAEQLDLRLAN
jgi:hypothetical protein